MASSPITSWEIDGETVSDFVLLGAPKSLQMLIAAMKLKDAYSFGVRKKEGKLLRELVMDRQAWHAAVHGVVESDMTE